MKKILIFLVLGLSVLSANTKDADIIDAIFHPGKIAQKLTKEKLIKRIAFFEKRNPNLKNELNPEEQLEFVKLLYAFAKIK